MTERLLITGSEGFLGRALRAVAEASGVEVVGVGRRAIDRAGYHTVDLERDPGVLGALLDRLRPSRICHLAGGAAAADPFAANVTTTRTLIAAIEAVARYRPRVMLAGSAAEYGDVGRDRIGEATRERPLTEYGVAKLAATHLGLAARRRGLDVFVARAFNIIGPGMDRGLAPAALATRALAARARGDGFVEAGDLDAVRDYCDVEDVAEGFFRLVTADSVDEIVNVCSGRGLSIRALLEEILRQVGGPAEVHERRGAARPDGVPVSVGDPTRLVATTGWRPTLDLGRSVERLLSAMPRPALSPAA